MNCKECKWCTWACPDWMCMNSKHPDFEENSDYPVSIKLTDNCAFFENGENDYTRLKQDAINKLDFMIKKGYIDITDFNDELEFVIMTQAYKMWKESNEMK